MSSAFCEGRYFSIPGHPTGRMCRTGISKSIFWTKNFHALHILFSSHHSNGWVPTSSIEVFVQEACAQYWTLAAHQNEYYPLVSQWFEEFWMQERAAEQSATHPVCPWDGSRNLQGRTSSFEGQASGWYLSQHAHLLPWEHWGIPCTHQGRPLHYQAEGAGRKVQEAWKGCCEAVRGIEESPGSHWVQGHCLVRCWRGGPQGGDWADPTDAPRIPETAQWGNYQDVRATEEPPVRWSAVPMGLRLLQDAQAWLLSWNKRSSDRREASMHVDVLLRLSWAA